MRQLAFLSRHKRTFTALLILFIFSVSVSFAQNTPFTPGQTLDPDCLPGDANCYVESRGIYATSNGITNSSGTAMLGGNLSQYTLLGLGGNPLFIVDDTNSPTKGYLQLAGNFSQIASDNISLTLGTGSANFQTVSPGSSFFEVSPDVFNFTGSVDDLSITNDILTFSKVNENGGVELMGVSPTEFKVKALANSDGTAFLQADNGGTITNVSASSLGFVTSASNGLTDNNGAVSLGGTLTQDTDIDPGTFSFRINPGYEASKPELDLESGFAGIGVIDESGITDDLEINTVRTYFLRDGAIVFGLDGTDFNLYSSSSTNYAHASTSNVKFSALANTDSTKFLQADSFGNITSVSATRVLAAIGSGNAIYVDNSMPATPIINTALDANSGFMINDMTGNTATLNTGSSNIGIGPSTLIANTSGFYNTAIGQGALSSNTSGFYNIALGPLTLASNVGGNQNLAFGLQSLGSNISGSSNIAIGYPALSNSTSSNNIAIGGGALVGVTTGSNNIGFGNNVDVPDGTVDNQMTIGNIIYGTGIDGNGSTISSGKIGIKNQAPLYTLHVGDASLTDDIAARFENENGTCDIDVTNATLACSSDMNLKKNITNLADNSSWIYNSNITVTNNTILSKLLVLNPVTYNWNKEQTTDPKHIGFIAQEVQEVFPELVNEDPTTHLLSLNYTGLIPYTIEAIKEMNLQMTDLDDMTKENTLRTALLVWFQDAQNGITKLFANEVDTKKLCVGDDSGAQTCVTKTQLDTLLAPQSQVVLPLPVIVSSSTTDIDSSSPPSNSTSAGETPNDSSPSSISDSSDTTVTESTDTQIIDDTTPDSDASTTEQ